MKFRFTAIVVFAASTSISQAYVSYNNGVNWDKNGSAVCTYGQLKSCGYAAAQGDRSAANYLDQRIANNPNPNKNTFYNYQPPSGTQAAANAVAEADFKTRSLLKQYEQQQRTGTCAGSCVTTGQISQAQQDLNYAGAKANQINAIYGQPNTQTYNYSYNTSGYLTSSPQTFTSPSAALSAKTTPVVNSIRSVQAPTPKKLECVYYDSRRKVCLQWG